VAFYTGTRDISDAEFQAFCQSRLASYKIPRKFVRVAELPTNPNGKINRRALKQRTDIFDGET
jgi:acyl-CoA synthetase (AMP-forming)/AMP-acid ligase II